MPDLMTRLAALHTVSTDAPDDRLVAADLHRCRAALRTRRRHRSMAAGTVTLGVVAVSALSYSLTTGGTAHPQADHPVVTTTPAERSAPATSSAPAGAGVRLVDYHGDQLPGYTVTRIPQGYVLQGISGSVLDVAERGDHSSLDVFSGKLVVMLNDHPGPAQGQQVSVHGRPARINDEDGVLALTWNDGTHDVEVQSWSNITITRPQLVQFAEGVTVLPGAQVGHG